MAIDSDTVDNLDEDVTDATQSVRERDKSVQHRPLDEVIRAREIARTEVDGNVARRRSVRHLRFSRK